MYKIIKPQFLEGEKDDGKDKCPTCGIKDSTEPYTCPYQADIKDDDETLCTCCPDCQYECAMDILGETLKELKKMPIIKGRVPWLYDADVTADMCKLLNAHSAAIDHLAEENRALSKEVERLSSKL